MEKEEKVVVVLLLMVLSSLLTAYVCFGSESPVDAQNSGELKQYTRESAVGERVFLEGEVLNKQFTHKGNHLLLQVDCNSEVLSIFIPKTAGAESLDLSIKKGDYISLKGTVTEYEGKREIKVERQEDVCIK